MRSTIVAFVPIAAALFAFCSIDCSSSGSSSDPGPKGPFGIDARPANATCLAPQRAFAGIKLTRVFPKLTFEAPLFMVQAPGDPSKWYVVEQGADDGPGAGIKVFDNRPEVDTTRDFIRFAPNEVPSGAPSNEAGLLGFAFHPDYASNRTVYLSYTTRPKPGDDPAKVKMRSVVKRFQRKLVLNELDRATEATLVSSDGRPMDFTQPDIEHKNTSIAFGNDGKLYIGFGDGGEEDGAKGQDITGYFAKILRIDVDPAGGATYKIPADNPWVEKPLNAGELKETWARGFRNPWRFAFDHVTGELWAGDVGDDTYEEVNLIVKGGNYGWRIKEGTHCTNRFPQYKCPDTELKDPVVEYVHGNGDRGVIGGYVYRGSKIPALVGSYIFADLSSGRILRMIRDPKTGAASTDDLAMAGFNVSSLAEGLDGELYVIDYINGKLFRIDPLPAGSGTFPQTLSATGCVNPQNPKEPAQGLIPYEVNTALWSDGAGKKRWFAIPDGTTIQVGEDGDWDFPIGSVLMKQFTIGDKMVETRLFVRHQDGEWAGYSYEWNDAQTDATLLPALKTKNVGAQEWTYPGRSYCLQCHTVAAGRTLGLENAQLNGDMLYPGTGRVANQLSTIEHLGMLKAPLGDVSAIAHYAKIDGTESLEIRARSYLHANCAGCHRPGGPSIGPMDLRFAMTAGGSGICNVDPFGEPGVVGSKIVMPGDPSKSVLSLRIHSTDPALRMPPLATRIVHAEGTKLIDDWITSLTTCPPPPPEPEGTQGGVK